MTKLTLYSNRMMEIGWIVALITTPLFFNVFSSRIFEPDKIALLRSISLLVLVSWIVKALEATVNERAFDISIQGILQTPLLIPVIALIFNYLISTLISVAPSVSLWGSYQRLQGTFTTYSYIVLFLSMVFNRPTANQIRRMVTVMIAVSLPVAVYGLLQRYKIDPIPWGGDVSVRIASTMGNSIFVAAYLIMVFPLTLGRIVESFQRMLGSVIFQLRDFLLATSYVFIALLQVVALYFSGSRGPALGWLASLFFFALCLVAIIKKRNYGLVIITVSVLVLIFLIVFNLPQSPLESLKQHPSIGRFGQLLDPQSNNARVRTYIWQGAVKLYGWHPPLEYPDGRKDVFNWLRPFIGYGPETMYVAYNRFYVPELTQVERRNASPDRSHNETWDSLIFTGGLGFIVYVSLFLSLFYYGYRGLGIIENDREKKGFWIAAILCGVLVSTAFILWRGFAYFGVAFPTGMMVGFLIFLSLKILLLSPNASEQKGQLADSILMISLLSALLAHWVEINFGIAIVSTRTYFWVIAAMVVLLVSGADRARQIADEEALEHKPETSSKRKKRAGLSEIRNKSRAADLDLRSDLVLGIIVAMILFVLGYNFMNATELGSSTFQIIWKSFTEVQKEATFRSNGILIVISLAWIISSLLLTGEENSQHDHRSTLIRWTRVLGLSLSVALLYWIIHASLLAAIVANQISNVQEILDRIRQYEGLLVDIYLFIFFLMLIYVLIDPDKLALSIARFGNQRSVIGGIFCFLLSLIVIYQSNIRVIQADIAFKLGESFSKPGSWPVAIQIYRHAIELAPREDYYYLFLGRAYLENARELKDISQQEEMFSQAKSDLMLARSLNPLNTDHTANLARLYSQWSLFTQDKILKEQRLQESDQYFAQAVSLSPNNSRIWGEWAVLLMSDEKTHDQALSKLMKAYELDPTYDWISYLFGEYYRLKAARMADSAERKGVIELALSNYHKAATISEDPNSKRTYFLMTAQLAIEGGLNTQAIDALENVLSLSPNDPENWKYEQTLAQLYFRDGQKDKALLHAQNALKICPPDQKQAIEDFIAQILQRSE
ncbi:MAG: hypothetical protein ACK44E_05480 [Anaerolineales bacterium]